MVTHDIEQLQHWAESFDRTFDSGFALIINQVSDDGATYWNMVSNVNPRDLIVALKLQIARLEGQCFPPGHA